MSEDLTRTKKLLDNILTKVKFLKRDIAKLEKELSVEEDKTLSSISEPINEKWMGINFCFYPHGYPDCFIKNRINKFRLWELYVI